MCHLDCAALFKRLWPKGARTELAVEDRRRILQAAVPRFREPKYADQLAATLSLDKDSKDWCVVLAIACNPLPDQGFGGSLCRRIWQADHIIPVAEGGGLCGLENMRTLCVVCHADASRALAGRGAKRRRDAGAALDPHTAAEQAAVAAWEEEGDEDFEGAREAREKKKRAARKTGKKKATK